MAICLDKAGLVAGLVLSSTSDTANNNAKDKPINGFFVDNWLARAGRLRRSVLNSANCHENEVGKTSGLPKKDQWKCLMLTCTYAPDENWEALDVTGLIKCIREYLRRKNLSFRFVWVLENTKAGRPHYHILMWLPRGYSLPKPDNRGWWKKGLTRIEWIRLNAAAYIAKYCAKSGLGSAVNSLELKNKAFDYSQDVQAFKKSLPHANYKKQSHTAQGIFPSGARLHGYGGLSLDNRWRRSWWNLPAYVRKKFDSFNFKVVRAVGGGFISRLTGEWMPSAFEVLSISPLIVLRV